MRAIQPILLLGVISIGCIGIACRYEIPNHCANHNGDLSCAERRAGLYCDICSTVDEGCTNERPAQSCQWTGVGQGELTGSTSAAEATSITGPGELDESSTSESDEPMIECLEHGECLDDRPICDDGRCITCTEGENGDAACRERDEVLSVCVDGRCVPCTGDVDSCGREPPTCQGDDECSSCTAHEQCGDAACNLFDKTCLPQDAVVHVGVGPGLFGSIDEAMVSLAPRVGGTIILHGGFHVESIKLTDGVVLAILAHDGERPVWIGPSDPSAPQLVVTNGTVIIDGLSIAGSIATEHAVQLDSTQAHVWIDRSRIVSNVGGGVLVREGAELMMRNCFVGDVDTYHGDDGSDDALRVEHAKVTIASSTVIAREQSDVRALQCEGEGHATITDSILLKRGTDDTPLALNGCVATFDHCASEQGVIGVYNVGSDWESWFTDLTIGDFTLTEAGADVFANLAEWNTGDPPIDILGTQRPNVDGTPDYVGAHVLDPEQRMLVHTGALQ
ncbi:hypothetical protein [Paraliomyxa miuraensis]|uniref:hypothetical protein n=1 Tax=Paraliomyxa miuraensis TaxID=376150 RepID=UPI002252E3D9|nr:hypothetical protein [Paraliomyxa miuraensis]MCX4247876.1 hypothetical protein [Paraliomyxa miuraensis]